MHMMFPEKNQLTTISILITRFLDDLHEATWIFNYISSCISLMRTKKSAPFNISPIADTSMQPSKNVSIYLAKRKNKTEIRFGLVFFSLLPVGFGYNIYVKHAGIKSPNIMKICVRMVVFIMETRILLNEPLK